MTILSFLLYLTSGKHGTVIWILFFFFLPGGMSADFCDSLGFTSSSKTSSTTVLETLFVVLDGTERGAGRPEIFNLYNNVSKNVYIILIL